MSSNGYLNWPSVSSNGEQRKRVAPSRFPSRYLDDGSTCIQILQNPMTAAEFEQLLLKLLVGHRVTDFQPIGGTD